MSFRQGTAFSRDPAAVDGQDSLPSLKICRSLLSGWVCPRTVSQGVPGNSDGFCSHPPFQKLLHQTGSPQAHCLTSSLPANLCLNGTPSPAFHIALNPKRTFVVCQLVLNRRRISCAACRCLGFGPIPCSYITLAATPSHLQSAPHLRFPARTKPKTHFRSLLSDNANEH